MAVELAVFMEPMSRSYNDPPVLRASGKQMRIGKTWNNTTYRRHLCRGLGWRQRKNN